MFKRSVMAVFLAICLAAFPACAQAQQDGMIISGHRGAYRVPGVPENTLASFKYAADAGADSIEFDVRWTRDSYMVILHDNTLDRTSTCSGPVEQKTFAEAKACGTPSFGAVLKFAKSRNLTINPEVKPVPNYPLTAHKAYQYVRAVNLYGWAYKTIVSSASAYNLHMIKQADTARALKYSLISDSSAGLYSISTVKASGTYYMPDYHLMTAAQVQQYRNAGIHVWLWPARNATDYAATKAMRPNAVVPDDPAAMIQWLKSH